MKLNPIFLAAIIGLGLLLSVSGFKKKALVLKDHMAFQPSSDEILFSCSYTSSVGDDDCIPDNLSSFTTDNISVAIVLKKILDVLRSDTSTKITANFLTYECHFPQPVFKALTKKSDSTRYILYTKQQLGELMKANTNWVAYSIFSHEIGHHLYGHSLSNAKTPAESRKRELQADFFSGFVLYNLKANLDEAQSGINAFNTHPSEDLEEDYTHPTKSKRLISVKKGFDYAAKPTANTQSLLNYDSLKKVKDLEEIFNKSLEFFIDNDYKNALEMLTELIPLLGRKYQDDYHNTSGVIKMKLGHVNDAIKDFDKAIEIDDTKSEYYKNRAETKKASSQKVLQAESIEDFKQAEHLINIEN